MALPPPSQKRKASSLEDLCDPGGPADLKGTTLHEATRLRTRSPSSCDQRANAKHAQHGISSLNQFPDELLLLVFDGITNDPEFGTDFHTPTFHSLALTNRRFHELSTPYLYSGYDDALGKRGQFIRTVLQDSRLGVHVKTLHWHMEPESGSECEDPDPDRVYTPSWNELRDFHAVSRGLGLANTTCLKAYTAGGRDWLLTMALLHLRNVERLHIWEGGDFEDIRNPLWLLVLYLAATNSRLGLDFPFRHLHTLEIVMPSLRLEELSQVLLLPSLYSLRLCMLVDTGEETSSIWRCRARSSTVESIELADCFVDSQPVASLILSCKALRFFTFYFSTIMFEDYQPPNFAAPPELAYDTLGMALRVHKSSLEYLSIEAYINEYVVGSLGSLHDMEQIKFLNVDLAVLGPGTFTQQHPVEPAAYLPPKLEVLKLQSNIWEPIVCLTAVFSMIGPLESDMPNLAMLHIQGGAKYLEPAWDILKWLRGRAYEQGIQFDVYDSFDDDTGWIEELETSDEDESDTESDVDETEFGGDIMVL